jgi:hypothetical protein
MDFLPNLISKNILEFLNILNPFPILKEVVEETKENYTLRVNMRYLNELIKMEILEDSIFLKDLKVGSMIGKIVISGTYDVERFFIAKLFKIQKVNFSFHLVPIWVRANSIRFRIKNYRLENSEKTKFKLLEFFSKFDPFHKKYILNELVSLYSYLISLTRLKYEVRLNLNYFLQKARLSNETVKISRLELEENTLILYLRSSVVLKPLIEVFGSNVIDIQETKKS